MKVIQIAVFTLFFLTTIRCHTDKMVQNIDAKATLKYFDLKGFIEAETDRISKMQSFTKTAYVNGEKETKTLSQINIENELKPFYNSDINKPAWAGKYTIDSTFNQANELIGLRYQSKDEKLKTKTMSVDFVGKEVSKVFIENATNSSVANTYQTLIYQSKAGFSVESKQDVSLLEENYFKIEVSFQ